MRWFRAYRKFGGRLALFALALQFYLSFAHIHPDDIYGPVGQALSVAEAVNLPARNSFKADSRRPAVVQRRRAVPDLRDDLFPQHIPSRLMLRQSCR